MSFSVAPEAGVDVSAVDQRRVLEAGADFFKAEPSKAGGMVDMGRAATVWWSIAGLLDSLPVWRAEWASPVADGGGGRRRSRAAGETEVSTPNQGARCKYLDRLTSI